MASPLTPQQARAVAERAASVVLASGAGCGKTHVLTARYLSHLEDDGAAVAEIVAITFTERAAREMRGRIRKAAAERLRAAGPDSPAGRRWQAHLRALESAPIGTIHGFCGSLLRRHAAAAKIDPGFDVLDEARASLLRADAVRDELRRLLTAETEAGADLRELVVLYGWAGAVGGLTELLRDADPAPRLRWLGLTPEAATGGWRDAAAALRRPWLSYLGAASAKIAGPLALLRRLRALTPAGEAARVGVLNLWDSLAETPHLGCAVEQLCELAKISKHGRGAWPDDAHAAVRDGLKDLRETLPDKLALFLDEPGDLTASATVGARFLRVAAAAGGAYGRAKQVAGGLDFGDLLVRARDLLRDSAGARDAARREVRFLLLDELQDTDPVQMELVELLCGDGLRTGKLFAVGDAKQSIYRFRGAEVSLFEKLRDSVPAAGRLDLSRNYRSQPGVLRFVNALCSGRMPGYVPLEADRPGYGGRNVEFLWSEPAGPGAGEGAAEVRAREADAVAERIAELVRSETAMVRADAGGFRPARPGDVALLFRSLSNVATYESALRRRGLDYYLVGGRAFFAQQEVYDLWHLARAVENPHDAAALAGLLRSPFAGLSDEGLFLLGLHRDGLWAGLRSPDRRALLTGDDRRSADRFTRRFEGWRARKDRLPTPQFLAAAVAESGYDAALRFEFLAERKLANLWKLIDISRDFDRAGLGLAEFAARLADLVQSQPREEQAATQPEESDAVRMMSIHQSKGLEFPVVFVPDLGATGRPDHFPAARWHRELGALARLPADHRDDEEPPFSAWPDRLGHAADALAEWREDLRVLYVACTRARDYLVLSAGFDGPQKGTSHALMALAERYDLATGRCVADDVPEAERESVVARRVAGRSPQVAAVAPADDLESPWPPPLPELPTYQPIARPVRPAPTGAARLFLAAFARWEFADRDGWGALLAEEAARAPDARREEGETAAAWLQRWADSPLRIRAARAAEVRRGAVAWGGGRVTPVDLWWRDAEGDHAVAFAFGDEADELLAAGAVGVFELGTGRWRPAGRRAA